MGSPNESSLSCHEPPLNGIGTGTEEPFRANSLQGTKVTITATDFALTVLTFEAAKPSFLLRGSYEPVFAHHVVVCPLQCQSISSVFTEPFLLHPFLIWRSPLSSNKRCFLSVTVVPSMKLEELKLEVEFRKDYGPVGQLTWEMVKRKDIPCAMQWRLLRETKYTNIKKIEMARFIYSVPSICDPINAVEDATRLYHHRILSGIANICSFLEPIVIG